MVVLVGCVFVMIFGAAKTKEDKQKETARTEIEFKSDCLKADNRIYRLGDEYVCENDGHVVVGKITDQ